MLETLHVKNLAIIDEVEVEFKRGLNILTGETGAGKSVIIGSMNLALGEKAGRELIRKDAEYALVELAFFTEDEDEIARLKELEIYPEEGQVILSRKISDGRSICKINGETVPVSGLKAAAEILIDLHGQHEHQSLLYKKNHLNLLDRYAAKELGDLLNSYEVNYASYRQLLQEYEAMHPDEEALRKEAALLEFEIKEIQEARLLPGEDEDLENSYRRLSNNQKIMEALSMAYQVTGSEGAGAEISRAYREVLSVASYDDEIAEMAGILEDVDSLMSDFNRNLSAYMKGNAYDAEEFANCENRLNLINHLKSKYGRSIEDILSYLEKSEDRLEALSDSDGRKLRLESELKEMRAKLEEISDSITKIRKAYAVTLGQSITDALVELNFEGALFEVSVEELKDFGPHGLDSVEFLIRTNPGESLKPLEKVASGGELSRVMLALISTCADQDQVETLIFDEIDTGISGRTAQKVAEKLAIIAAGHQVICITHLPQIAAMADTHFVIEKSVDSERTVSSIHRLTDYESEEELARLLGGVSITDAVMENAREMKALARAKKTIAQA